MQHTAYLTKAYDIPKRMMCVALHKMDDITVGSPHIVGGIFAHHRIVAPTHKIDMGRLNRISDRTKAPYLAHILLEEICVVISVHNSVLLA